MKILGVDLAAQPGKTAWCRIEYPRGGGRAAITGLTKEGCDKHGLLCGFKAADKVGIDAPFGWPDLFVRTLAEYQGPGARWPLQGEERDRRRFHPLRFRATDRWCKKETKKTPLSVSTEKLGVTAFRNAELLTAARDRGLEVDRSGLSGRFVEVYPAAALAAWFPDRRFGPKNSRFPSYKGNGEAQRKTREELTEELVSQTDDWLDWKNEMGHGGNVPVECWDDDRLDAVISAIVTFMVWLDPKRERLIRPIPKCCAGKARREGWMALPRSGSLGRVSEILRRKHEVIAR